MRQSGERTREQEKIQADTLPADSQASGKPLVSASEATLEENYTLSQVTEDSSTATNLQESETSMDELADCEPPAKRPNRRSK